MGKRGLLVAIAAVAGLTGAAVVDGGSWFSVEHLALDQRLGAMTRRAGHVTANLTGTWSGDGPLEFRLNDEPWRPLIAEGPRFPDHQFTIELFAEQLVADNTLRVRAGELNDVVAFRYDPTPIELPVVCDWSIGELDVQDGRWEVIEVDGERRVRPVPGSEGYDRIVLCTGAFSGPRRVTGEVVFRKATSGGRFFGFGVIPLWGGHRDVAGHRPRRGWSYGLGWYYSRYDGVGVEFSRRVGDEPMAWVNSYRNTELVAGARLRFVAEAEGDADTGYRLRMKWWQAGSEPPQRWVTVSDRSGAPLDDTEFAVALLAHRCQVEFGPVTVAR